MSAAGCASCSCYLRGLQDAAYASYSGNLAATAQREMVEHARQNVQRWHEQTDSEHRDFIQRYWHVD